MIELAETGPVPLAGSALRPEAINAWTAELVASIEGTSRIASTSGPDASNLDDAARVDAIRALEQLACVATAAQAELARALDRSVRQRAADRGVPAARQGRGVEQLVAYARRESPHRGSRHLGLAKIVQTELPHTWSAWRTGRITEWKATIIARETACLSLQDRLSIDYLVAQNHDELEALGDGELAGRTRAAADQIDPEAAVARRRYAEGERQVSLRPAPDTMTWLTALLPVKDGVAVHAALTRQADSLRAQGDPRGRGQVMADELVAAVTTSAGGQAENSDDVGRAGDGRGVELGLVMTSTALFGEDEEPAHLAGYGPIPAELAREIVREALAADERVWVRRLFTRPDTQELVAADSRGRLFRGSLARFIRLRDQTCRTPWCDAPIRHNDHAISYAAQGATAVSNSQGLCESCNLAKEAPGWSARPDPGPDGQHGIRTTLPTGHRYTTRPPPLATVREVPLRVSIDYVLTA